ncbi:primosomal protein N' [Ruminiclostridium papyrosolvens DSM 2782]|uniref:Replication restart protein PriA n=1 Tax=Ruminiclostridium papyrosolvens DSM 2782 TaxID=588581 RepID=F1TDM0_9FIRM|nr:primosomal protein N' [Ruminiclostridium papyrosolvens]EGD47658.1 primosomal protein N' [Ruminiclostridium papyrosolvens DSM 2782]WES36399.1 primosomal protein N' [Ruminiclostridium papyrosolvens DSM 2782]
MKVTTVSVVLSNTTRAFDKKYTYSVPEYLSLQVFQGCRVLVPFGNGEQVREGFVLDTNPLVLSDKPIVYKEIKEVIEPYPLLTNDSIQLLEWMKRRYICTYSDIIKCMLPPGISVKTVKNIKINNDFQKEFKKTGLKKVLSVLSDCGGECEYEELRSLCSIKGFKSAVEELCQDRAVYMEESYEQKVNAKTVKAVSLARPASEILDELENNRIKRIQHVRVLEILLDNEIVSVSDIQRFAGVTTSVLDTLSKHGYISYKSLEIKRNPLKDKYYEKTEPLSPTEDQANALAFLKKQLDCRNFQETLLHGITGSGKTEVYLQLISHCFLLGKKAILLVPEISLTPQMVERFVSRFGNRVAVIHSKLSLGERFDQWKLIRDGKVDVVVGARSAVFAPMENLGLIVIDEEHEGSYKSESLPRYNAKDVARKRCEINNCLLVYGSATPSVETYYNAQTEKIHLLEMQNRPRTAVLPKVELVDMRVELENGNKTPFSSRLVEELLKNKENNQQSILFLNRRGFSTFVICRNCGYTMKCPECSIALTYHSKSKRLICHYCGFTVQNPSVCPSCKSENIRYFGIGTQKIEEEVIKRIPETSVIRMDMDTVGYKNAHEEILNRFKNENINIMVGTQMIAKGHDFPNVTLVGVLAADGMLNTGDYRASERTFQLLTQVAGRAGRGDIGGRVIIQTYNTDEYSIIAACKHDFKSFYNQEITIRKRLDYPPFTNIALVTFTGKRDRGVFEAAKNVKPLLCEGCSEDTLVLGPSRCPVPKIANKYRWRFVVKERDTDLLIERLSTMGDRFWKNNKDKDVTMSIDINPYNML